MRHMISVAILELIIAKKIEHYFIFICIELCVFKYVWEEKDKAKDALNFVVLMSEKMK